MTNPPWLWPAATVTRVVDGDSFYARVSKTTDIGFRGTSTVVFEQKMRLNRVNAPKIATPAGAAAAAAFTALVGGIEVMIKTTKAYKYGDEWMAEITLPDGRNVSDELVSAGVAVYWDGTGPRPGG